MKQQPERQWNHAVRLRPASVEEAGLCYENPSPERRNEPACSEGRLIDSINC